MELGLLPELLRVQSGGSGPHAEPDIHILRSTTPHSSRSSGADQAGSSHLASRQDVPKPTVRLTSHSL